MVQVCAHRGVCYAHQENTLNAFSAAIDHNADSIELDVWLSKDNKFVVHHDKTCNGTDIESESASELPSFVPALQEVFSICETMPLNIELKMSTITESDRLADELLQVLSHVKNKSTSINPLISSFNLSVLQNLRQRSDEIRLGYLSNQQNWETTQLFETLERYNFQAIHPHYSLISREFMKKARERKLDVNVWTVNERSIAVDLMGYGVDSIITDDVQMVKEVADSYSSQV